MSKKPSRPTKTAAPRVLRPALSPFDVETTLEAKAALAGTISEIVVNFLAKGIRAVAVPIGQANAVKAAFEEMKPGAFENPRRWHVEIAKVNGVLAELRFHTDDDPRVTPPVSAILPAVDDLLAWSRTPEGVALSPDDGPLGKILGNLRVVRALVEA